MPNFNRIGQIALAIIFSLLFHYLLNPPKTDNQNLEDLVARHHKTEWNKLNQHQKLVILREFIENERAITTRISPHSYDLSSYATHLLQESNSHCGIVLVKPADAQIINVEEGLIRYMKNHMEYPEAPCAFYLIVRYNAGKNPYRVTSFQMLSARSSYNPFKELH